MANLVQVSVHPSQFPEKVQEDLRDSLRTHVIAPKFHYDSYKQSQKWLALHEAYSPARTDADCALIYDQGFLAAAEAVGTAPVHLIGLGCGGGQKDARLLFLLAANHGKTSYTPCDVSLALVLASAQKAESAVPGISCQPLVCDLASVESFPANQETSGQIRLFTFFGIIPNFEPEVIMPRLASWVGPGDFLLFSANLAPGSDYAEGVKHILPGYDNLKTRDWLFTFLHDLGVEPSDGVIQFSIEESSASLRRVVADFCFLNPRKLRVYDDSFEFRESDKIRLFFSYRYTPTLIASLLARHGFEVHGQWITKSEEEGLFLCRKSAG